MTGETNSNVGRGIRRMFWLGMIGLAALTFPAFGNERPSTQITGALIAVLTILPSYLWCMGKVEGVPIFPAITLACLPTYALPMINLNKSVLKYDEPANVVAGITVCGFLIISTACWLLQIRGHKKPNVPSEAYALDGSAGKKILFLILTISIFIEMLLLSGWLDIDFGIYALLRSSSAAMSVLTVMCISYGVGAGTVKNGEVVLFYCLFCLLIIVITTGLYLSTAFMLTLSGAVAYVTASRKLPLAWILTVFLVAIMLHPGKNAMRAHYWSRQIAIPPQDYPEFYSRWIDESMKSGSESNSESSSSNERSSIIHMLMLVQKHSPDNKPFLLGDTLVHIPTMLLPRILIENKPEVHLGQKIMCVYYGLQTTRQTATTAIAFGPIAEAYANFGYLGVACWAVILGTGCGWLTRTCFLADKLTAKVLFAFVTTGIMINGEKNFAVIVSMTVQSGMFLAFLCIFIMKISRVTPIGSLITNETAITTEHQ